MRKKKRHGKEKKFPCEREITFKNRIICTFKSPIPFLYFFFLFKKYKNANQKRVKTTIRAAQPNQSDRIFLDQIDIYLCLWYSVRFNFLF